MGLTVQEGSQNSPGGAVLDIQGFPLSGQAYILRLYKQYVRPHLEYASPAWSQWLEADKEVLEKIQKRAVNMVSGLKASTYERKI